MSDRPEIIVSPNHLMMLEKVGPDWEAKTAAEYQKQRKADPDGRGRINPIRARGESETRLSSSMQFAQALRKGAVKEEQLKQVLLPRGYVTDVDSNIFMSGTNADFDGNALSYFTDEDRLKFINAWRSLDGMEDFTATRALVQEKAPLQETEYVNRKVQQREESIKARMAEGMTREEAERSVDYNSMTLKQMRQLPLSTLEYIDQLEKEKPKGWKAEVKALRAEIAKYAIPPKPALVFAEVELKRLNKERLTPEEHAFYIEQVVLKQHEMFPSVPGEKREHRAIEGKIAHLEMRIEALLVNRSPGWAADIVDLRREQADLTQQIAGLPPVEPPAPPPILDFSTGDLEIPERFIIKDLELFKFDPDTKFDGLRLPYESCLFVLGEDLKAVVLASQEDDDVIQLKLLSEQDNKENPWHAEATLYVRLKGQRAELKWIKTKRSLDKRLGMVSAVLGFLAGEQLNELEIETVITAPEGRDIPPPKPGWCYNVVHVQQGRKGKRKDWQGGTHASPREHKRRGYWWPGKKGPIWIKATIVNKGVLGRVDKEYHVSKIVTQEVNIK